MSLWFKCLWFVAIILLALRVSPDWKIQAEIWNYIAKQIKYCGQSKRSCHDAAVYGTLCKMKKFEATVRMPNMIEMMATWTQIGVDISASLAFNFSISWRWLSSSVVKLLILLSSLTDFLKREWNRKCVNNKGTMIAFETHQLKFCGRFRNSLALFDQFDWIISSNG